MNLTNLQPHGIKQLDYTILKGRTIQLYPVSSFSTALIVIGLVLIPSSFVCLWGIEPSTALSQHGFFAIMGTFVDFDDMEIASGRPPRRAQTRITMRNNATATSKKKDRVPNVRPDRRAAGFGFPPTSKLP